MQLTVVSIQLAIGQDISRNFESSPVQHRQYNAVMQNHIPCLYANAFFFFFFPEKKKEKVKMLIEKSHNQVEYRITPLAMVTEHPCGSKREVQLFSIAHSHCQPKKTDRGYGSQGMNTTSWAAAE